MLATMVDHVIGIDPDRDWVTASVVDASTTAELASARFGTTSGGYAQMLEWANQHTSAERAWAVEGAGSYGTGAATALVTKCHKFRPSQPTPGSRNEHTATKMAMRSLARRIRTLTTEIAELQTSIAELVETVAPQLLDQPGIGPITAAQIYIAWSHPQALPETVPTPQHPVVALAPPAEDHSAKT